MIYLVLVKMIHGNLPRPELLARHGLSEVFLPLAQAIRSGDLGLFDRVLLTNQAFYMRKELFILIQLHLRNLILRSLFKKVYLIGLAAGAHPENRQSLRLIEGAFYALGIPDMSMDEVECITANLIFHVRPSPLKRARTSSNVGLGIHQRLHFSREESGCPQQKECLSTSQHLSLIDLIHHLCVSLLGEIIE